MTYQDLVGTWTGTNGFRLLPGDPLAESAASATLATAAGGNLLSLAYTWRHPADGPQDGLLVSAPGEEADTLTALWGDSWHQQPAAMSLTGGRRDGAVVLTGAYGGGWGWQIRLEAAAEGQLRLRMDNVVPADHATAETPAGPYPVMVMDLHRA